MANAPRDTAKSALATENRHLRGLLADAESESAGRTDSAALSVAHSDLVRSKTALADSLEATAFLSSVLHASPDCIKVLNLAGEIIFINSGGHRALEIDDFAAEVEGCPWPTLWKGELEAVAHDAMQTAREGGVGHFVGEARTMKHTPKWWDVTVTGIPNRDGRIEHLLSISRDVTEAKQNAFERQLLADELSHRVKNILAVVQAIATQTFRDGDPAAIDAFQSRVVALGTAQDLLLQSSWRSASLPAVVERALAAHCPESRRQIEGGDHVIDAKRALSLALALHELATNSIKYGALSAPQGRVQIRWSVNAGELSFIWSESGGPMVVEPERTGFGTQMITRNLASGFRGDVDLNYLISGIVLTLKAPA